MVGPSLASSVTPLPWSLRLGHGDAAPGHLQGSLAQAWPTLLSWHRGRSPSDASSAVTECFVAAGSDPGAREQSASICHREWVAKLSPELKMGLIFSPENGLFQRKNSERAELEPLATVLEVSVLPQLEVSQIRPPGGYSYRGLSGVGTLGNFGWLVQLEPSQVLPSLQTGLVTVLVAFQSCRDSQ